MSTTTRDPLIDSYLKQLGAKARSLPRSCREELLEQIEEHLRDALPPEHSEAETRNVLEQLGDPSAIVAEERDRLGIQAARPGRQDWAVVLLLPLGFWLGFIGWILGVFFLWTSRVWTTREKVLGTVLPPGGLSAILLLAILDVSACHGSGPAERCSSPPIANPIFIPLFAFFVITGIATPIFLGRRAFIRGR